MGSKSSSNQSNASQQYGSGQNYSSNTGVNLGLNQSGSTQGVWGHQQPFLNDVYKQGRDSTKTAMGAIRDNRGNVVDGVQGAFADGMGAYGNVAGGGAQAQLLGGMGSNPYVDAMNSQIMSDAGKMKQQTLGSLDGRAAAAGMSGSSGYRNQMTDSFSNIDQNAMNAMANVGYNAFNQDMQNRMALAQGVDQNMTNAANMTTNMQNASMNQYNPYLVDQQVASNYASTIGGPHNVGNSFSNGMSVGVNTGGSMGNNQNWGNSSGNGSSSSFALTPPNMSFMG
jgi:hypothetical protein